MISSWVWIILALVVVLAHGWEKWTRSQFCWAVLTVVLVALAGFFLSWPGVPHPAGHPDHIEFSKEWHQMQEYYANRGREDERLCFVSVVTDN